jgi:hypothetical protein
MSDGSKGLSRDKFNCITLKWYHTFWKKSNFGSSLCHEILEAACVTRFYIKMVPGTYFRTKKSNLHVRSSRWQVNTCTS